MNDRSLAWNGSPVPEGCQAAPTPDGTAERILARAIDLFAQYGYAGTGMRHLARATGIAPGAIYNHFASKQVLLEAIVANTHASLLATLTAEASTAAGDAPGVRLERLVRAFARHVVERPAMSRVAEREFTHLEPWRRAPVEEIRRTIIALLEQALVEAVAAGTHVLPEAGPLGARRAVTSVANMLTALCEALPSELAVPDDLVELHVALVRQAFVGHDGPALAPATGASTPG